MNDWQEKSIKDFCKKRNVEVYVTDDWKSLQAKFIMTNGKKSSVRYLAYDVLSSIMLPSALLNDMYKELQ